MAQHNHLTHALQHASLPRTRNDSTAARPRRHAAGRRLATAVAALSLAWLAGCGGGHLPGDLAKEGANEGANAVADGGADTRPSLQARGDVAPAGRAAEPVDAQARTRSGRYVSRVVAERTDQETGGRIVWVDAGCCAGQDPDLPALIAVGMQAVLGDEAPLYVSGSDLRQAARLADRLDELGLGRVYLVTP